MKDTPADIESAVKHRFAALALSPQRKRGFPSGRKAPSAWAMRLTTLMRCPSPSRNRLLVLDAHLFWATFDRARESLILAVVLVWTAS